MQTSLKYWFFILLVSFLQRDALENEKGIADNPLQISWLGGMVSTTDVNLASVSEATNATKEDTFEEKVFFF